MSSSTEWLAILGVHAGAAFQTAAIDRADHIVFVVAIAGTAKELAGRRASEEDSPGPSPA
ncbi:MAG: hypothetical protein FWD63_09075 [Propionibacteriaceae bacterium]|nr:hypothetical protein [Propionibacteriaceae bacterium]